MTWARLGFRQQRWELILVATGVALVAAAMLFPGSEYLPLLGFAPAASLVIVVRASAATVGVITRFGLG